MAVFVPGQRWINDAQLQMGLGTVISTDFRTVTIIFLAVEETFVYAKESVPLTRVRFSTGDEIITADDQTLKVVDVHEADGLIIYEALDADGETHNLPESQLSNFIQFHRPSERLFNNQIDRPDWFDLRYRTRQLRTEIISDPLRGLAGGRVSLIPHQLYIANEVASRYAPRVLLADEVGLGKTIEAGMIIHHQLVTERARRILIVVPDSLVHQWLVEMLRRFNLHFRIFDAERMESQMAVDELDDPETVAQIQQSNPFQSEQLVLCSLEFLCSRPDYYKLCRDGDWDLLVLDEAHHLEWSEDDPGFEYQLVEQLARNIEGVLLLTATPEQLGKSSHFARLRLLDPDRFPDFEQFVAEEENYQPVADAAEALLDSDSGASENSLAVIRDKLGEDGTELVQRYLQSEAGSATRQELARALVERLIDQHGTGRVLFRNTRSAVQGFPERQVHGTGLPVPEEYHQAFSELEGGTLSEMQLLLCPELLYQAIEPDSGSVPAWTRIDPRVEALGRILGDHRSEKILVIAASADTVLDLADWLRVSTGINAAVFHEGMTLVERDRAAAFFADQISGSQVLICSEIGSEGRNFQFSHHLVLFDLPLNPDLLEQRIGRLDRIGQLETIHLHVLYLEDTAQQIMFRWYEEGLNAFAKTCPVGHAVFARVEEDVKQALHNPRQDFEQLIAHSRALADELNLALQQGRDRLLEFNSCRPDVANKLAEQTAIADQSSSLQTYMEMVFDCFGVDYEIHSEGCYAVKAGSHLTVPFPQLPEEGMTVTYQREVALQYEDVTFLTWDHPLARSAMDMVLSGEHGNTSVIPREIDGVARGTLLLESIFVVESASTESLQSERFLPPQTIQLVIDQTGKRYRDLTLLDEPESGSERLRTDMIRKVIAARGSLLRKMVSASEKLANRMAPTILDSAVERSRTTLEHEIERLESLRRVNPNVRQEEIDFLKTRLQQVQTRLEQSSVRLDALRVIIAT